MESAKPAISQKEYLKRYLMKDKKTKVKKKKSAISSSTHLKRSVIIDDDINIDEIPRMVDDTFSLDHLGDEAPQIAGIIDERPEEMKLEEKYRSKEWKPLQSDNRYGDEDMLPDFSKKRSHQVLEDDLSLPRRPDLKKDKDKLKSKVKSDKVSHGGRSSGGSEASDLSPPRQRREDLESGGRHANERKLKDRKQGTRYERDMDSDLSPPRARQRDENSSHGGRNNQKKSVKSDGRSLRGEVQSDDSDLSPPRSSRWNDNPEHKDGNKYKTGSGEGGWTSRSSSDKSSRRMDKSYSNRRDAKGKDEWTDRRRKRASDASDSDLDVSRKNSNNKERTRGVSRREESSSTSHRRSNKSNEDSDLSPPRKDRSSSNTSRKKRSKDGKNGSDSDLSPPRNRGGHDSDLSPPRKTKGAKNNDDRRNRKEKLDQMQDGKRAGLQDAKSLKDELRILKEKEDEMFRKMDPELLGRSTAAVVRDRKTGLKRDLEKERQIERDKSAKEAVRQQKYAKWGKGLKQVRDQEEKVADMVHEMSKPLARYADDDDLERALKAQEREGDPMLEYIKRHQKESHSIDLTDGGIRKKYMGSFLPNRFNIAPGHRWDGVDRSNGYEQKWFEAKNAKKATSEEAWKWSSADM